MAMDSETDDVTWADVAAFIKAAHLDRSEYFHEHVAQATLKERIWARGYPCAYWMRGGSEGWYVHVARNVRSERKSFHEDLFLGKFWSADDAAFAVDLLTRFMNGEFSDVQDLIARGTERFA